MAQTLGDYRSIADGNWNLLTTWQMYDGSAWVAATSWPGQNAIPVTGAVTIQAGDTVTIPVAGVTTQTIGTLTINGTLSLNGNFVVQTMKVVVTQNLTPYAVIKFDGNYALYLPDNASISVGTGGLSLANPCNSQKQIIIGDPAANNPLATCNGNSDAFSFDELMAAGGTLTSVPVVPPKSCLGDAVQLQGAYTGAKGTPVTYLWQSSGPAPLTFFPNNSAQNPTVTPTAPGAYTIRLTVTTTKGVLIFDNAQDITLVVVPTTSTHDATICGSELPYTWGGHVFTAAGSWTISGMKNSAGCDSTATYNLMVNPSPTATITTPDISACTGDPNQQITFKGSGGSGNYTFYYHVNSDAEESISTTTGSATVSHKTLIANSFVYQLDSVKNDDTGCSQVLFGIKTTLTINKIPQGIIGTSAFQVCQNDPSPQITFTGSGGSGSYKFYYTLDGVAQTPLNGSPDISISVPTTAAPKTYTYILDKIEDNNTHCENSISDTVKVKINELPQGSISGTAVVCQDEAVAPQITFKATGGSGKYIFHYNVNGGATRSITSTTGTEVIDHPTNEAGVFQYNLTGVEDANTFCQITPATGTATITVNELPSATISGTATVCQNSTSPQIVLNGSGGSGQYTFYYTLNKVAQAPVTSVAGNTSVVLNGSTTTAGTFVYNLTRVEDADTHCTRDLNGVVTISVLPLPVADIHGDTTVCQDGNKVDVTFTATGGTAPYTFTYQINSEVPQTIITNGGNVATLGCSTALPGTFVYHLLSVKDAVSCENPQTGTATVNVSPISTTTVSVNGATTLCQNSAPSTITFTGSGGVAPYTFTYKLNDSIKVISTVVGSSTKDITCPTNKAGTFTYELVSVKSAAGNCENPQTASVTITVNPMPVASIAGNATVCQNSGNQQVTFTASGGVAPYTFTYKVNGGGNQFVTTTSGNSVTVNQSTTRPDTYTYELISVHDATPGACPSPQTGSVTITVNPVSTATISGGTSTCQDALAPDITFTGFGGTAPYTFTYKLDGVTNSATTDPGKNSVVVSCSTTTPGSYKYELVSVRSAAATCENPQTGSTTVVVLPKPSVTVSAPITVCQYDDEPQVVFTGSGGTGTYRFTYTVNEDPAQTRTETGSPALTVYPPTDVAGKFTYHLLRVEDAGNSCVNIETPSVDVTVLPVPTASMSVDNSTVCQKGTASKITFTGNGGTGQYEFTYTVNGQVRRESTLTGSKEIEQSAFTAGIFKYVLIGVRDLSAGNTCMNTLSDSLTILVTDLPEASLVGDTTVCQNQSSPYITFKGRNGKGPYQFSYRKAGDPGLKTIATKAGSDSVRIAVPTGVVGDQIYTLEQVEDLDNGCANTQTDQVKVTVSPLLSADITVDKVQVCQKDIDPKVTFTGAGGSGSYIFTYTVNDGNPQTVSTTTGSAVINQPTSKAGDFRYKLIDVLDQTKANSCHGSLGGTVTVKINPLPTATILGSDTVCLNQPNPVVTFTGVGGKAPYTFTYTFDNGAPQTISTTFGNTVTLSQSSATAGTFKYELVSVKDAAGAGCENPQSGSAVIVVKPLPTATISGTDTVCQNNPEPKVIFKGANGTAPYTFSYKLNNGATQTVTSVSGDSAVVSQLTSVAGTYTYTLVGVRDGGNNSCFNSQAGSAVVTVHKLPTATISGTTSACQNDPAPEITFTATSGIAPFTFTYSVNDTIKTISTISGNSVKISQPTNKPGIYTYKLLGVADDGLQSCMNSQTGSAVITVNELPTATMSGTTSVCKGEVAPKITFSGNGGSGNYRFYYTVNNNGNISSLSVPSVNGVAPVFQPTTSAGKYIYTLTSVEDQTTHCTTTGLTDQDTITVRALPTATILGTTTVCQNEVAPKIKLVGYGGSGKYIFEYNVNGGSVQTISTNVDSVEIPQVTDKTGTFKYNLVSVRDAEAGCPNLQTGSATVTVKALPTATITSSATSICQNGIDASVTFRGVGGSGSYTFSYKLNGKDTTVTTLSSSVVVYQSSLVPGDYVYELTGVKDNAAGGCENTQTGQVKITVNTLPTAVISATNATVCKNDISAPQVKFTGSGGSGSYIFTYKINTTTYTTTVPGESAIIPQSTANSGTFVYRLVSVRDASSQCVNTQVSGEVTVTVNNLPGATISTSAAVVCQKAPQPVVTFTGSAGTGVGSFIFTYLKNGKTYTVKSPVGSKTATVLQQTDTAGIYTYNLISVEDSATGCHVDLNASAKVEVHAIPTGTITFANTTDDSITVCQNNVAPEVVLTGVGGTAPYKFTYSVDGSVKTVTSLAANSFKITPSSTSGRHVYKLLEVSDSPANLCWSALQDSVVLIVKELPTASISCDNQTVCLNDAQPQIVFTAKGGTAPYTFTYRLNGQDSTITTKSGNSIALSQSTTTGGIFNYTLVSVKDAAATSCVNPQTGTVTVKVYGATDVRISGGATVCQNSTAPVLTFSVVGGVANVPNPVTVYYRLNGVQQTTTSPANASSWTITQPTSVPDTFVYQLDSVRTYFGCVSSLSGTATVVVKELARATISVSGNTPVCKGEAFPKIILKAIGGKAPYSFVYKLNGVSKTIVSEGKSDSVVLPQSTQKPGTYTYELVSVADSAGCPNTQSGKVEVVVLPVPTAAISGTTSVCQHTIDPAITFTGGGSTGPYRFTYSVNGAEKTVETTTGNTAKVYQSTADTGKFVYKLLLVEDTESGCRDSVTGTATITVNAVPIASISGTSSVCENDPQPKVTLTGTGGSGSYVFTYQINKGTVLTKSTTTGTVEVPQPTTASGVFVYKLLSVKDLKATTTCVNVLKDSVIITVNKLPSATISVDDMNVCQNDAAAPVITFEGANGSGSYIFTYQINGSGDQTLKTSSGKATLICKTSTSGTFVYKLISVQDSATGCISYKQDSVKVKVNALPVGQLSSATTLVCQNEPARITFSATGGSGSYEFTYKLNNNPQQTVQTVNGNVTVDLRTQLPGIYTYHLIKVRDRVSGCENNQTNELSITVNALPTATVSGTTTVCQNAEKPKVVFKGSGGTGSYTFTYTINNGSQQQIQTTIDSAIVYPSTALVGQFVYKLISVVNGTTGCVSLQGGSATVTVNALLDASISSDATVCQNEAPALVTFTGIGGSGVYTFNYRINNGEVRSVRTTNGTATVQQPTGVPGSYIYTLVSIIDEKGAPCESAHATQATTTITVLEQPTAQISGTTVVNQLSSPAPKVTFTGSGGSGFYVFTYKINNGTLQTAVSSNGVAVVTHPTDIAGTYIYTLVSVQDDKTKCINYNTTGTATVTVNSLLNATVSSDGNPNLCPGDKAPDITFRGYGGSGSYVFTYRLNGNGPLTISTSTGTASVSCSTSAPGNFDYSLVSIRDVITGAESNQSGSALISVHGTPVAIISGTTSVTQNSTPLPKVTFRGLGGSGSYIFTYKVNGSNELKMISTTKDSVLVPQLTSQAGTFIYELVGVQDAINGCSSTVTGSATIVVNPALNGMVTGDAQLCQKDKDAEIVFTGMGGSGKYIFTYTLNDGKPQTISTSGSKVSLYQSALIPGAYVYRLLGIRDIEIASENTNIASTATVNVHALPMATIEGTTSVVQQATTSEVTFTGMGGSGSYIFTYTINDGLPKTVIASNSPSAKVYQSNLVSGIYTYKLISVQDKETLCSNSQSGTATITVVPMLTATVKGDARACQKDAEPQVTFTGLGGSGSYIFTYTVTENGKTGSPRTVSTSTGSASVAQSTLLAGTYVYTLMDVKDVVSGKQNSLLGSVATITVSSVPNAMVQGSTSVAQNDATPGITFTGVGGSGSYIFTYTVTENGKTGDSRTLSTSTATATVYQPTKLAGTYVYTLVSIEDALTGCRNNQSAGSATVVVNGLPTATISGTTRVCQKDIEPQITFTGKGGSGSYIFTYTINGGAAQTVNAPTGSVSVSQATAVADTFVYALLKVQDAITLSQNTQTGGVATIIVNPLPTATISGAATVVEKGAEPKVTLTGSGGSGSYVFTYTINGGAPLTVGTQTGSAELAQSTLVPGDYVYNLVSVRDGASGCENPQGGSVTITVQPLPTSSISGSTEVCQYSISPDITFTGMDGVPPYTFHYNVNGGSNQTITTIAGASTTVSVPTNVVGKFVYNLVKVVDSRGVSTAHADSAVVVVNSLPVATISGTTLVAQNSLAPVMFNASGGKEPYVFTYRVDNGGEQTVASGSGSKTSVNADTSTPGIFTYNLISVEDAKGCSQLQSGTATITVVQVPNTFTPNGDGINDRFMEGWHVKIYNRNGILLYDGNNGWDGTYNGRPVSKDTYFYILYFNSEGKTKTHEGYITLIR